MSFPRLALVLATAFGLPLLTGACGAPVAATAVSYGADGATVVGTGKSTTDHFASMVSKKDCALWRVFKNQSICREQEGDPNPYHVNYDEPWRDTSNGVPEYSSPLRAPANAPATSWDASVYAQSSSQQAATPPADKPTDKPGDKPSVAPAVTAEATPAPAAAPTQAPAKAKKKHTEGRSAAKTKTKAKPAAAEPAKTPSPDPAATAL